MLEFDWWVKLFFRIITWVFSFRENDKKLFFYQCTNKDKREEISIKKIQIFPIKEAVPRANTYA